MEVGTRDNKYNLCPFKGPFRSHRSDLSNSKLVIALKPQKNLLLGSFGSVLGIQEETHQAVQELFLKFVLFGQ